ncbi:MAG: ribosomal protein S18-alanine N-acetyltransferase [Candidatus Hermodarchaeota archaeon]
MLKVDIRPFQKEDIDDVLHINQITLPEHYPAYFFHEIARKWSEGFLVAAVDTDDGHPKIVGYCMIRIEKKIRKGIYLTQTAHLLSIAVLKKYRKQGIASMLLKRAYNGLKKTNKFQGIYLEARESNTPAISLYKKLGFEIVKIRRNYYTDGENAVVMAQQSVSFDEST